MAEKEPTYPEAEIADKLTATLPGWYYENGWIRRVYATSGWPQTLMVVNTIGFLAEAANHHPDLSISWARVIVKLNTHSAGGITDKDLQLAEAIERHVLWKPANGFPGLEGHPKSWVKSGEAR